jgi:hypothetical protein
MYLDRPTLLGGNTGTVNSFNALDIPGSIVGGKPVDLGVTGAGVACLLKQALSNGTPSLVAGLSSLPVEAIAFLSKNVLPIFDQFDCK